MERTIKVNVNGIRDILEEKRCLVDELTISGLFKQWEWDSIKKMCNSIIDGKRTGGRLATLDMSRCKIDYFGLIRNPDFIDCISLRRIILPSDIYISDNNGGLSFSGCKSLESINVAYGAPSDFGKAMDIDGVLFWEESNKKKKTLVKYPANKGTEYKIPECTSNISMGAFEDCQLTRLIMPVVPPTCEEGAFRGVNLTALTFAIPKGSYDSYWLHPVFGKLNIEELCK